MGFGERGAGVERAAEIFFAATDQGRANREFGAWYGSIGQQAVFFSDRAGGKLFGQRAVGLGSFSKNQNARGFFIQPMNDGEGCPAWLAMTQPIVNSLSREWTRCVSVKAR